VPAELSSSIPSGLTVPGDAACLIPRTAGRTSARSPSTRSAIRTSETTSARWVSHGRVRSAAYRIAQATATPHRHDRRARQRPHRIAPLQGLSARVEVASASPSLDLGPDRPAGPAQAAQERVRSARPAAGDRPLLATMTTRPAARCPFLRPRHHYLENPAGPTLLGGYLLGATTAASRSSSSRRSQPAGRASWRAGQTPSGAGG
jgi:hypothetical protein